MYYAVCVGVKTDGFIFEQVASWMTGWDQWNQSQVKCEWLSGALFKSVPAVRSEKVRQSITWRLYCLCLLFFFFFSPAGFYSPGLKLALILHEPHGGGGISSELRPLSPPQYWFRVCALRNYQCEPLRVASWINNVVRMLKEEGGDSSSSYYCDLKLNDTVIFSHL